MNSFSCILHILRKIINAIIFLSLEISEENIDSRATIAQSQEHATSAPKIPGSSPDHFPLFDQNLGNYAISDRIRKIIYQLLALVSVAEKYTRNPSTIKLKFLIQIFS